MWHLPSNTGTCAGSLSRGDTRPEAATVFTISSISKPCERVADTAAELRERPGQRWWSLGPGSTRCDQNRRRSTTQFGGTAINAKTARRLIANQGLMVYDNPHCFSALPLQARPRAVSTGRRRRHPKLEACVPTCGNAREPIEHAAQLRAAPTLDQQAAHAPNQSGIDCARCASCGTTPTPTTATASPQRRTLHRTTRRRRMTAAPMNATVSAPHAAHPRRNPES